MTLPRSFHLLPRKAIPRQTNHLQVIIDIRYQYAIIVSSSRHDPLASPPKEGALRTMRPRQVVLLNPSESVHPNQLLFYKQNAPVSPLFATLTSSVHLYHSKTFSRPLFSYSYALFCTNQKSNSLVFKRFRTLCAKQGGGGCQRLPFLRKYFNSHSGTLARPDSPSVPRSASVLVHSYLAKWNRICTRSPIVPWTPPGYTLSSTRRTAL